jgi:membrane protease YdiL (CAAX protease family)
MKRDISAVLNVVFSLRWKPSLDLVAVALSWVLVVGSLYVATHAIGTAIAGGIAYFLVYAVLGATIFGVGIPLVWTVFIRKRHVSSLGLTWERLLPSLTIQLCLAVAQFFLTLYRTKLPPFGELIPLIALSLAIGFFEAVFWRGWVQLRLEEAFGLIPSIVLGSILYALYHIGYGMSWSEMQFLFVVGIVFAIVFRLTKSILVLWPLFQPMGQLVTLIHDKLTLPTISFIGFVEALAVMIIAVFVLGRVAKKKNDRTGTVE